MKEIADRLAAATEQLAEVQTSRRCRPLPPRDGLAGGPPRKGSADPTTRGIVLVLARQGHGHRGLAPVDRGDLGWRVNLYERRRNY